MRPLKLMNRRGLLCGPCRGYITRVVSCRMRMCEIYEKSSIFIRDNPIFSSERMLHKDYYRKSSVGEKISSVVSLKGPSAKTN
jgi:hypothetical protein